MTNRQRIRMLRNRLVHAAGCCTDSCIGALCYRDDVHFEEWDEQELQDLKTVRIPRSLRKALNHGKR